MSHCFRFNSCERAQLFLLLYAIVQQTNDDFDNDDIHARIIGATKNGRPEIGRSNKNKGWKMADLKKADQEIET